MTFIGRFSWIPSQKSPKFQHIESCSNIEFFRPNKWINVIETQFPNIARNQTKTTTTKIPTNFDLIESREYRAKSYAMHEYRTEHPSTDTDHKNGETLDYLYNFSRSLAFHRFFEQIPLVQWSSSFCTHFAFWQFGVSNYVCSGRARAYVPEKRKSIQFPLCVHCSLFHVYNSAGEFTRFILRRWLRVVYFFPTPIDCSDVGFHIQLLLFFSFFLQSLWIVCVWYYIFS